MRFLPLLLALASCSPAGLLNALVPDDTYTATRDIAYADGPRHTLDVYVPRNLKAPAPVIVFLYGGSWQMGQKEIYPFVGEAFAEKGFITVIPDYRVYPQVYFPAFVEDAARAFIWTERNIADYGGDAGRLFVAGHSAGGQVAALLALDPAYLRQAGGSADDLRGLIGLAGPYDFLPLTDPKLIALFSKVDIRTTQPINYANGILSDGHKPASFLAAGDKDETVRPRNSANLAGALRDAGNTVTVRIYPGVGHIGLILSLSTLFRGKAPALDDIAAFVNTQAPLPAAPGSTSQGAVSPPR